MVKNKMHPQHDPAAAESGVRDHACPLVACCQPSKAGLPRLDDTCRLLVSTRSATPRTWLAVMPRRTHTLDRMLVQSRVRSEVDSAYRAEAFGGLANAGRSQRPPGANGSVRQAKF